MNDIGWVAGGTGLFGILGVGMTLFLLVITIVPFFIILGILIFIFSRILKSKRGNAKAPVLTVHAVVVSKRLHVMNEISSYYVTFEVDSKDRMELHVMGSDYGMLVEGDQGQLTFRGNEYLEFVRE